MSQFSPGTRTPTPASSPPDEKNLKQRQQHSHQQHKRSATDPFPNHSFDPRRPITPPSRPDYGSPVNGSPVTSPQRQRSNSRPLSMVQTYQPPLMDVNGDTIPELQPVFSLLNSHANKLYQEGYFLKLDDQNTLGKPNPDRTWTECFAQLVGTVLSLWDAAELDAAGEDGEVLPKFINLTDASIKMIESLPTRSAEEQPLQNILSISTAGRNRYLLHFNSHHSLVQWTAGIRLAMYEHSTLQEAYTGALIAGKGKTLNNINIIMERSRVEIGEWVRVRFGAGVPWRRCWCVITPPDEKEFNKMQKELKKRSPYDRSPVPVLKGDIKFYDQKKEGKKQKKLQPIATLTDAYSAYAIYPQAKSLVDASTLLKIEGHITIHTEPPSSSEGFVFIMPEVRPAVSGFEMLLRFLFPTWDTFGLYGRPGRLIASVLDARSLMFAMPKHRRYGYLELIDVNTLIVENGSSSWNEREWRKRLKEVTGTRMNAMDDASPPGSQRSSYGKPKVGFADERGSTRSSRSFSLGGGPPRTDSAPPGQGDRPRPAMAGIQANHVRNSSDSNIPMGNPMYNQNPGAPYHQAGQQHLGAPSQPNDIQGMPTLNTPEPVARPPAFNHSPEARPVSKVYHSPEMRQANSRLSMGTLAQLAGAGGLALSKDMSGEDGSGNKREDAFNPPDLNRSATDFPPPLNIPKERSNSPSPFGPPNFHDPIASGRPQTADGRRPPGSPGGPMNPSRGPPPPNDGQWGSRSKTPPAGGRGFPPGQGRGRPPQPYPPPRQDSFNTNNSGGYGPGGQPGPYGFDFDPPSSTDKHASAATSRGSITTNEIIEHYATNHGQYGGPYGGPSGPAERQLPFHPHPGGAGGMGDAGRYDDRPSTADRPRAGVLKTVGSDEPGNAGKPNFDLPDVDFGPTYNYAATTSPPRKPVPPPQGRPYSPAGQKPNFNERMMAREGPDAAKRTMAWQPGAAVAGGGGHGLPAQQYVQQRAVAAQPQYAHARSPSGNVLPEASSATPNHVRRSSSFDMLQQRQHSRSNSSDLIQRPGSRGGNGPLQTGSSGEPPSHLSAREQEQMARVTGAPLVNVGGPQRGNSPGPGLVGAIDARERERQQMRQGVNNQAAQYSMAPRHQQPGPPGPYQQPYQQPGMNDRGMSPQPMYQQPMGRGAGGYGPGPGGPGGPGGPRGPGGPQGGPYGGPMAQPPPSPYGPSASFSRPMREGTRSPQLSDPRQMPPRGQYPPGPGGEPRGVHPQYQGQAF
ncbi:hypothetical protein B0I35DRAFT_31155 [Stachybotrys elegans]|uniref:PH domain-containing protein n=1 Tax=Stachybotrys elegans TaxID=80388 RepID=A0A8K0T6E1_9HYPO|nr:hypothetical protein B0I35DRAFT_31155 [Stachybotrys elegans]